MITRRIITISENRLFRRIAKFYFFFACYFVSSYFLMIDDI